MTFTEALCGWDVKTTRSTCFCPSICTVKLVTEELKVAESLDFVEMFLVARVTSDAIF